MTIPMTQTSTRFLSSCTAAICARIKARIPRHRKSLRLPAHQPPDSRFCSQIVSQRTCAMIAQTATSKTCPALSRRIRGNKLSRAGLRTAPIAHKGQKGLHSPFWRPGDCSLHWTLPRRTNRLGLDSQEWERAWRRELVASPKPLSENKPMIYTYTC